jgi:hypothetical protein
MRLHDLEKHIWLNWILYTQLPLFVAVFLFS